MTSDPDFPKISGRPPGPSYIPKIMPIGPSAAAGEAMTHGRKARKYIRIYWSNNYFNNNIILFRIVHINSIKLLSEVKIDITVPLNHI